MNAFEHASAVSCVETGSYHAHVPDGWQQGRGAFGGLVLATLVRAMKAHVGDPQRRLRSMSGDLCGPVLPSDARVRVDTLRQGKNLSNVEAAWLGEGDVLARASGVFATPRKADAGALSPVAPPNADWTAVALPDMGEFAPIFTKHLEYRSTGPAPFSAGTDAVAEGFVRFRDRPTALDEEALIALLDAWWPALFSVMEAPRPMATVSFTAEILSDPAHLSPETPLRYRGRVIAQREGFFVEFRELWSEDVLVALNQQTFAVLA